MSLNKKEKAWIDNSYIKLNGDLNKFSKFLKESFSGDTQKQKEFTIEFNELKKLEITKEEDKEFKNKVDTYLKEEAKEENKGIIKKMILKKKFKEESNWIKEVRKFITEYKQIIEQLKLRKKDIQKKYQGLTETEKKKLNELKREWVESILSARGLINIDDPITGEIATIENLMENDIKVLMSLLEDDVLILDTYINKGKKI